MGTADEDRVAIGDVVEVDGEEFAVVACDDCGAKILAPIDMEHEVNFCRSCSPTTEDYDPEFEEAMEAVVADDSGIEID